MGDEIDDSYDERFEKVNDRDIVLEVCGCIVTVIRRAITRYDALCFDCARRRRSPAHDVRQHTQAIHRYHPDPTYDCRATSVCALTGVSLACALGYCGM